MPDCGDFDAPEVTELPADGFDGQLVVFQDYLYVYDAPFDCWTPLLTHSFEHVRVKKFLLN